MASGSDGKAFEQEITADPSKFIKGFEQAVGAATSSASAIDAQFKKIGDAIANVNKVMGGFAAVLAGGGALKKFISDANDWNGSAGKMAVQLGISTQQASVLKVALNHLGLDSEVATTAAMKLSKSIQTNGQAFDVMGVKVRDSGGAYRPVTQIMGEVNAKLAAIKNPIEQNIAGMQFYGKSWNELRGILKLNEQAMDEAAVRAKELGLIVGPEGVAASKQYSMQMRDLALVGDSLEVQFGNALLPVFTKVGAFMASNGPAAGQVFSTVLQSVSGATQTAFEAVRELATLIGGGFRAAGEVASDVFGIRLTSGMEMFSDALKGVEIVFVGFKVIVLEVLEVVKMRIDSATQQVLRFADVLGHAFRGDFSGAKAAWERGGEIIEDTSREHWEKMVEIAKAGKAKVDEIVFREPKKEKVDLREPKPKNSPQYDFGKGGGEKGRVPEWEARLAQDKAALEREGLLEGQYREMSKAAEHAYWQELLKRKDLTDIEKASLSRKAADVEMALVKQTFDVKVKALEAEAEHWKNNTDEKMRVEKQIQSMYQAGTTQFEESRKRQVAIERQAAEQQKQVAQALADAKRQAALSAIALEEQAAQLSVRIGLTTQAELLQQQLSFEQRRYEITRQALKERQQLLKDDLDANPVERARVQNEIEALEQQHQTRMAQIKGAATENRLEPLLNIYKASEESFARAINGILTRTQSLRQAMASLWQGISSSIIGELAKIMAKKAAAWAMEKVMAIAGITTKAAEAGAGAASSVADIPYVGPVLALAAMASVFAGVSGMKDNVPSASAFGGYDIPGTVNPVVQAHAKEMILPAKHADVIRGIADGGGSGRAPDVHLHVHAVDAADVKRLFIQNTDAVAAGVRAAMRDNALTSKDFRG